MLNETGLAHRVAILARTMHDPCKRPRVNSYTICLEIFFYFLKVFYKRFHFS